MEWDNVMIEVVVANVEHFRTVDHMTNMYAFMLVAVSDDDGNDVDDNQQVMNTNKKASDLNYVYNLIKITPGIAMYYVQRS